MVQDVEHRDIKDRPADHPQKQGDAALAEALEDIDGEKAEEHQRGGQNPHPDERGGQTDGLGVRDEKPDDPGREGLIQQDTSGRHHQTGEQGQPDDLVHPFLVAGGAVVGHQGHHALTDPDAHIQGQPLHLQDNADGCQRGLAVGHHQLVDDHIVQVKQEAGHRRRDAHRKNLADAAPLGQAHPGIGGKDAGAPNPPQNHQEIAACHAVGQQCGNADAQHLLSVGQEQIHKDRVQDDIQDGAQGDSKSRLPGQADAAHQVGHDVGQDSGHSAQHDDAEGILPGIQKDGISGPQKTQGRPHKGPQSHRERQRQADGQIKAEGADFAGLGLLPGAQQAGNQGTAAHPCQGGQAEQHVEDRQDQGSPRQHIGVAGAADVKSIRHIVDQHDDLTDGGRDNHLPQRHRHRLGGEQFILVLDLTHGHPPFSLQGAGRGLSPACFTHPKSSKVRMTLVSL